MMRPWLKREPVRPMPTSEVSLAARRFGRLTVPVGRSTMGIGILAAAGGGFSCLQELLVGTFFGVGVLALVTEFGIQLVFIGHALAHGYRLQPRHDESWRHGLPKPRRRP
jgi:hypothetical protein